MAELINRASGFSAKICSFYFGLNPSFVLPEGVNILQPYSRPEARQVVTNYYERYYTGNQERIFLLGINPGRFGGGITGIPFTDPVQLQRLDIPHNFPLKTELSSTFVYEFINAYGGLEKFAAHFFLTAICPVGFTRNGKNYNYYDDAILQRAAQPWISLTMKTQLNAGALRKIAVCLGEGTNYRFVSRFNEVEKWFDEIIALPHPRWIMQYKRKSMPEFRDRYVNLLNDLKTRYGS